MKSKAIVSGIGINISTKDFPKDIENKAGSIMCAGLSRNKLIAETLNNLFDLSEDVYSKKNIEEYKNLSSQGNGDALYYLGEIYFNGSSKYNISPDKNQAIFYVPILFSTC